MSNEIEENKKLVITLNNPNGEYLDMTAEEITKKEADIAQSEVKRIAQEEAKAEQDVVKASGNTKLLALGLTQVEATSLTGYTPPEEE